LVILRLAMGAEVQAKRFPPNKPSLWLSPFKSQPSLFTFHFSLFTFHSSFFILQTEILQLLKRLIVEGARFFFSFHSLTFTLTLLSLLPSLSLSPYLAGNLVIAKITLEAEVERPIIIPSTKSPKTPASPSFPLHAPAETWEKFVFHP